MSPFQLGVFGHVKKTANSEGLRVWIKKKNSKRLRMVEWEVDLIHNTPSAPLSGCLHSCWVFQGSF